MKAMLTAIVVLVALALWGLAVSQLVANPDLFYTRQIGYFAKEGAVDHMLTILCAFISSFFAISRLTR